MTASLRFISATTWSNEAFSKANAYRIWSFGADRSARLRSPRFYGKYRHWSTGGGAARGGGATDSCRHCPRACGDAHLVYPDRDRSVASAPSAWSPADAAKCGADGSCVVPERSSHGAHVPEDKERRARSIPGRK